MSVYRTNLYSPVRWGATNAVKSRIKFVRGIKESIKGLGLLGITAILLALPAVFVEFTILRDLRGDAIFYFGVAIVCIVSLFQYRR